jgi:hypothetical protein
MKKACVFLLMMIYSQCANSWGFYAHKKINYLAVFLLPPEMIALYKPYIGFLSEHAVDPDKRRYAVPGEGSRHYIDIDRYGLYPYDSLPKKWQDAVSKYSEDTLLKYGIVPWWLQTMLAKLTDAFKKKDQLKILKYSAEIGHYIADSHVPLHANSNHNGQYTGQNGIHGFWESRIPELLAEKDKPTGAWDFFIGRAEYIKNPADYIWKRVLESAAAADSVLKFEKILSNRLPSDQKFSYENRNGITVRQYSTAFSIKFNEMLNGMVERRMRQSVFSVASFWYTAWVNAGQPDLKTLSNKEFSAEDLKEFELLDQAWRNAFLNRDHEE